MEKFTVWNAKRIETKCTSANNKCVTILWGLAYANSKFAECKLDTVLINFKTKVSNVNWSYIIYIEKLFISIKNESKQILLNILFTKPIWSVKRIAELKSLYIESKRNI